MSEFFKEWSAAIQAFSVIILIIITFWYARRTHLMAAIMEREYELRVRPYLTMENVVDRFFSPNRHELQLRFHIKNVCVTAFAYQVTEVRLNNVTITSPIANIFLFPEQEILYTTINYNHNAPILNNADGLQGELRVEFWGEDLPGRRFFFFRRFVLTPNTTIVVLEENFGRV